MTGTESSWSGKGLAWLVWGALILLFVGFAPIAPVNHDESQYLAAAALTGPGLPYIHYPYLQTPLQPLFTAPIAALADGNAFVALRLATALMALAALWFVFRTQISLGIRQPTALGTTMLMALTYSFQFGATLVRNDMLPLLLMSVGLYGGVVALSGSRRNHLWAISGVAFGAAAGTKLSYAVPALAVGIYHLISLWRHRDRGSAVDAASCALGAAVSFVPVALLFLQAPEAFRYGVFEFGAQGPFHWYRLNGIGYRLGLDWKLYDTAIVMLRGPASVAIVVVGAIAIRRRDRESRHLFLDLLIIGGLVAALLPTPTWRQYLLPLLPPLFVRFGLAWKEQAIGERWRRIVLGLCVITAIHGVVQPVTWALRIAKGKPTPVDMTREAHWIGERIRAAGVHGEIATLSPQVTIDSGYPLDPRFAAGPFAYRSGNLLSDAKQIEVGIVSPRTLDRFLAERPPAAIVTGYESRAQFDEIDLDEGLRAFAVKNGYRLEASPIGPAQLYLRQAGSDGGDQPSSSSSSIATLPLAGR